MADKYLDPDDEREELADETEANTEAQRKAVQKMCDWFRKDRDAKGFYNEEMDESDKLRTLKHWDLLGPTGSPLRTADQQAVHPNAIDPVVNALVEGFISEFAQDVDLIDYAMEEGDDEAALIMSDIKQYIAYKNRIQLERLKWLGNFAWHGTGIWKHVFDPTWIGGEGPNRWSGEIRWQSRHPRYVFPDMSCGEDIHQGRRIHDARYVTKEYLEDKYPEFAALVQMGQLDVSLLSDDESGSLSTDGQSERTLLVETWYIGRPLILGKDQDGNDETDEGKGLHVIWWCGESNPIYLRHANYQNYEPGVDPKFPFTFSQCYQRDGSCWGRGQAQLVKQLQIMINKVEDVKMEAVIFQTLGQTFYKQGTLSDKQQRYVQNTGTLAGNWLEVNDLDGIRRVWGAGIPGSVMEEPARLQRSAENALGRFDISMGRSPGGGSAVAFRALALLDQRAQVRLRPIEAVINAAYEDVGMYLNRLVWKNYTEQRAYRIIGRDRDTGRDIVKKRGVFQLSKLRKVNDFATGQALMKQDELGNPIPMREADLTPDFMAMQSAMKNQGMAMGPDGQPPAEWTEGEDFELYEPGLDVKVQTSASMPSERFFWIETAKDLLINQQIDLKTFIYVLEHGKFPPWATIKKAIDEKMAQMAAQAPPPQQGAVGSGGLPEGGRWTYTAQFKDPSVVQTINAGVEGQSAEPPSGQPQGQPPRPQPQQGDDEEISPAIQELLSMLSPEDQQKFLSLPPQVLQEMNSMEPDQLRAALSGEQTAGPQEWTAKGGMVPAGPGR